MGAIGGLAKGILGFFSIILALIGIAFLAVAGVVAVEFRSYASEIFKNVYLWGPVAVAIVLGVLLLLLGIMGIGGICCEKMGMLKAFATLMFLLIALEVAVVVLVFVYRSRLDNELQMGIEEAILKAYNSTNNDTNTQAALNTLQSTLQCCGGNGTGDYTSQGLAVPNSCCVTANCGTAGPFYTQGCTDKVESSYRNYSKVFIGVGIAFAALELIAFIYSCYVINSDDSKMA